MEVKIKIKVIWWKLKLVLPVSSGPVELLKILNKGF